MTFKGYKMSFQSAITFFIAIFIFGITPGPGVFSILARALVSGAKSCFPLAIGMVVSDLIYLVLACLGLASIAENHVEVFVIIRYIGALYLIYLGVIMIKAAPVSTEPLLDDPSTLPRHHAILPSLLQGFLISVSNPKVILFYIAFLPSFINLTVLTSEGILLVVVLTAFALTFGLMFVAYGGARAAKILTTQRAQGRLNKCAGAVMLLAGAYLAFNFS